MILAPAKEEKNGVKAREISSNRSNGAKNKSGVNKSLKRYPEIRTLPL